MGAAEVLNVYDMIGRELTAEEQEAKARAVASEATRLARTYTPRESVEALPKLPNPAEETNVRQGVCVYWRAHQSGVPCLRCLACERESSPREIQAMGVGEVGT